MLRFAGFELDQQRAELRGADGVAIKLRPKTFEMLRHFATNGGRVLSKQELMEAVWPNVHVGEDSLFQCIRELRTALGDERRQMIKLASGGGYLLTAEVSAEPAASPAHAGPPSADPAGELQPAAPVEPVPASARPRRTILSRRVMIPAVTGFCAILLGLAVAAPVLKPDLLSKRTPPRIAVVPIVDASSDPGGAVMATEVTGRLTDGFAKIQNISVVAPRSPALAAVESTGALAAPSDYEIRGELQHSEQSWTLRARLIKAGTGEVQSVIAASVNADEADAQLAQSRLAAGVGHALARRLNEMLEPSAAPSRARGASAGGDRVAIEQAIASINQTTRERFGMAQTMLQKALTDDPDNLDIAVALSSLQLRGIQMVWFSPDEAVAVEAKANATLEQALRSKPNSIPVLEAYCRFLSATNHFVESLVTCAKALSFDPWDGSALYLIGLGQIYLGRFDDALATFRQADRYDTPSASRWTWLLGAGLANLLIGRDEEALPWLQRSIAITPATGRSHMLLAVAYQRLGRLEEARAAIEEGLRLRPGTTRLNVWPPMKNASPVCIAAFDRVVQGMVDAGLPEQ
ncbi:transcriptional regulator CadC [Bradyrhizobium sp. NAS80.1]|uniref:winged helix-turn-helix domain-containing protein n=1 Tax=Bradyrhizobium sp. NAS80.1 TaxID=1680159 RepID=UPI00095F0F66|nr:winged helix-turn-helix domain-containing protein [Bradyrhizobium sp. NAS80.1]OKO89926.1 transcriptional regulator CadC [Bradyrhizobium sp. NAS80.1]